MNDDFFLQIQTGRHSFRDNFLELLFFSLHCQPPCQPVKKVYHHPHRTKVIFNINYGLEFPLFFKLHVFNSEHLLKGLFFSFHHTERNCKGSRVFNKSRVFSFQFFWHLYFFWLKDITLDVLLMAWKRQEFCLITDVFVYFIKIYALFFVFRNHLDNQVKQMLHREWHPGTNICWRSKFGWLKLGNKITVIFIWL